MAVSISIAIAQNSQNIANNTSNVTVTVKASWTGGSRNGVVDASGTPQAKGWVKIDGTTYNFASTFNWPGQTTTGSQTIYTKTLNITHGSDGKKTLSCSASYATGVSSGTVTATASKALTTIARKSTISMSSGTLGSSTTLTVTRQSTSLTHTIKYTCGTASGTICTKSSNTSISWTPPLSLSTQNTTGTTVSIAYTIETFSGNTSLGSNSKTASYSIPAGVKPSCSLTVSDPTGIKDRYGSFVKGLSKFKVYVSPTLSYGSSIKSYKTTANGSTYTASTFTTDVLKTHGSLTISTTVTDKRGRTGSASNTISVLNYTPPVINQLTVRRCDVNGVPNDKGDHVQVSFDATVSPINNQNIAAYLVRYKRTTDTSYTLIDILSGPSQEYSVTGLTCKFEADTGSSYDVEVGVQDNHNLTSRATTVSTGFTLMHWNSEGNGMGIGKMSELPNVLDVGMQTRFFGGIMHPVLEPGTDLDEVLIPNTYIGANLSNSNYNCGGKDLPISSGTFSLEVTGIGDAGQLKQRLVYCHKTASRAWERMYHLTDNVMSWGDWICVSDFDGHLLWDGVYYMSASQTATLSEPISKQRSGIVLVFSRYSSGTAHDYHFQTFFVPKYQVAMHAGCGHTFTLTTDGLFSLFAAKYLYIHDTKIVGNAANEASGTGSCGITYTNNGFVLRYVIGV